MSKWITDVTVCAGCGRKINLKTSVLIGGKRYGEKCSIEAMSKYKIQMTEAKEKENALIEELKIPGKLAYGIEKRLDGLFIFEIHEYSLMPKYSLWIVDFTDVTEDDEKQYHNLCLNDLNKAFLAETNLLTVFVVATDKQDALKQAERFINEYEQNN